MSRKKTTGKIVQFSKVGETPIYSLGFGDLLSDETLNKQSKGDNDYHDKALVVVAAIVYEFTARNPHNFVFFTGSDKARTKIFKRVLAAYIDQLLDDFEIYGIRQKRGPLAEKFREEGNYTGFIVKRKLSLIINRRTEGKLKDAISFGFRVVKNRSVDIYSGKKLFPGKLANALSVVAKLRWEKK